MKGRKEAIALIRKQLDGESSAVKSKGYCFYGRMELRELMDFIYCGEPESEEENVPTQSELNWK